MAKTEDSPNVVGGITSFTKLDEYYGIDYATGESARLYILNSHVIRFYMSPTRNYLEYPKPIDPEDTAKITSKTVSEYGTKTFKDSTVDLNYTSYIVSTDKIDIIFNMIQGTMTIRDRRTNRDVLCESQPLSYNDNKSIQVLEHRDDEYFFGGGMQNGRFSHKGEVINIVNTNNWVDGGVTSPCPFYWSSYGYGVLRNTWQPGIYNFKTEAVKTIHKGEDFDAFFFISSEPKDILHDYFELTGTPILMPEYAYYQAHLNAFNRDYWVEVGPDTPHAVLFEDGKYYRSYQPNQMGDKTGILESLNGEKNNYQFSARGMIDRYKRHDMPLGWFVPNDGYGCGYGQTDSLDGDIKNLKEFADYSRTVGVEVALWTESNLHPADPDHPKKGERDLGKEVGVAGVIALKCDVAWIGSGYSFGLTAVEDASDIFVKKTNQNARPMIIMVDGWAGTQRYSGIWSGDQTGGQWEYIRFHIPTYIGSGLSGQPVIGSDMDGIYGGGIKDINIRDYQWKTFTPLQLNMDGWGNKQKTPFSFNEEASNINRAYLKLKAMLIPYNYTIGHESLQGLPMIRAMFLEFPKEKVAYTKDTQYQFMWGPNFLVAPIYNEESVDDTSIRHGIYLPDEHQIWIDFFTGKKYRGGKVFNNYKVPLWKIPVFVRSGAIIPMVNPNNNPNEIKRDNRIITLYPHGESTFHIYEDDGMTSDYLQDQCAKTHVSVIAPKTKISETLYVNIGKACGTYKRMVKQRKTLIQIMTAKDPKDINVTVNGEPIEIKKVQSDKEFEENENVSYFKKDFVVNPYLLAFGGESLYQQCLLIKLDTIDVTSNEIQLKVKGYINENEKVFSDTVVNKSLLGPANFKALTDKVTPTSITLTWEESGANFYEIERDGVVFTNIIGNVFTFDGFEYDSEHSFRIRSAKNHELSEWSDILKVTTKSDPYRDTVTGVVVTCNIACQPTQEVCKLTDGDFTCMWHTDWSEKGQFKPEEGHFLTLTFDLKDVYDISKVEYIPREDAGNGTFLELQYRFSTDGKKWGEYSNTVVFGQDETVKTIALSSNKFRYMEIKVLNSVGGFGSGKQILFYKKVNL